MERVLRVRNINTLSQPSSTTSDSDGSQKENLPLKSILKKNKNSQRNGIMKSKAAVLKERNNGSRFLCADINKDLNVSENDKTKQPSMSDSDGSEKERIAASSSVKSYENPRRNVTKETVKSKVTFLERNDDCGRLCTDDLYNDRTIVESAKTKHVPIYKQMGSSSFRLSPTPPEDKVALYEFEVDENEEPVMKKKRPLRSYKKRKRPCPKIKTIDLVPERTVVLRGHNIARPRENVVSSNQVSIPVKTISNHDPRLHRKDVEIKAAPVCTVTSRCENRVATSRTELPMKFTPSIISTPSSMEDGDDSVDIIGWDNQFRPVQSSQSDTSILSSPLPDYSRIENGIHFGPVYTPSLSECSSVERNFPKGITASTPCKMPDRIPLEVVQLRRRSKQFEIRLSGGESLHNSIVEETEAVRQRSKQVEIKLSGGGSLHNSIVEETEAERTNGGDDVFGFTVDEEDLTVNNCRKDVNDCTTSRTEVASKGTETPKLSFQEVINLLKKDLGVRASNSPAQSTMLSCMRSRREDTRVDDLDASSSISDEVNSSFVKPPRSSYPCSRRARRVNYTQIENTVFDFDTFENDTLKETTVVKKTNKRAKVSKKEEMEMDKLAAAMNSQFKEVEGFKLVVE